MAVNLVPTQLWSGYSSDGTDMTIPIAAVEGLTAAEAHTTTGNYAAVMLKLLITLQDHLDGLAAADTPQTITMTRPTSQKRTSGDLAGYWANQYSVTAYNTPGDPTIATEPS